MQGQLLQAPVEEFGDIDRVLGRAGDLVNPAEFFRLAASAAKYAQNFSFERHLVNAARKSVGRVEILRRTGRDADCPRCAGLHGAGLVFTLRGFSAHPRLRVCGYRHVDFDFADESSVGIEDLNAPVAAIRDVDIAPGIGGDAVRRVELTGLVAGRAPACYPLAVFVVLRDARIDVAVAEEDVALGIPGDIGRLAGLAVDGGGGRGGAV